MSCKPMLVWKMEWSKMCPEVLVLNHMEDDDRKLMEERQKIIMANLAADLPELAV